MKKIIMLYLIVFSVNSFAESYELIIEDIKRNLDVVNYSVKVGQHLHSNKNNMKDIKESLRQASIINNNERKNIILFSERAGIIDKVESREWLEQAITYNEIVNKLKMSVSGINKELSYSSYSCDGVEELIYYPNAINQFDRALKISDVSAYQDFIRFFNKDNITIKQIPSAQIVIDYVANKENIKLSLIEEKLIYNNATSISMYNKVSLNNKIYYMFPYQMYPYAANRLEDLTALEYAWFALNLQLVGKLTPEILNTYKKVFKRNASLCLYSK